MKIEREEEYLTITNINTLIRFNKTREIFPNNTRVLSTFLTTAATSGSAVRVSSKERVPKVPCSIQATSSAQKYTICINNPSDV